MHEVTLTNWQQASNSLQSLATWLKPRLLAGHRFVLSVGEPSRSSEQNNAMWRILECFSRQLRWPVNGAMVDMSEEDWKDVLTAAFNDETVRLAQGLHGGVVMLGMRTSKMNKQRFSEFIEFLHATAAARGVDIGSERVYAAMGKHD